MKNLFNYPLSIQFFNEDGEGTGTEMISKSLYDKKISELNKKNKDLEAQLNDRMTDQEKKDNELKGYQDRIAQLEKENLTSKVKSGLVNAGLTAEEVESLTSSIVEMDAESLIKGLTGILSSMRDNHSKEIEKVKLESTPSPEDKDKPAAPLTRKEVSRMSVAEKQRLYEQNPDEFRKLYQ